MPDRSGFGGRERRAYRRLLCSEIVDVELFLPDGRHVSARAVVNDISAGGLCLQFDGAVCCTGFIGIEPADGQNLVAVIRHTYEKDGSFFVGASFINFLWSAEMQWPGHCVLSLDITGATRDEESDLLRIARAIERLKYGG